MENIIGLLQDKNFHLQRFYEMNETELMNFVEGNFDNLEGFYNTREAILDLIRCIDRLVEQANLALVEPVLISNEHKNAVAQALTRKNEIVTKILGQDLQILSVLETAKSNIIKELSQVKTVRKAVRAYKSTGTEPRLDEEA
ncbi:MAG: hypothetical protein AB7N80_08435 [Bdellovibrionales bacterium]